MGNEKAQEGVDNLGPVHNFYYVGDQRLGAVVGGEAGAGEG